MAKKLVIIQDNMHVLPFKEALNWETFEKFCTDVLASRLNVTNAREYLDRGNKQAGIDIYAVESLGEKVITAQCKLEKYLGPKDVEDIISLFLNGKFAAKSKEFILCTNYNFTKLKEEDITINNARTRLAAHDIELVLWDERGLSTELRINPLPQVVARYFNEEIATAFYGKIYEEWIKKYRNVSKAKYKLNEHHVDRSVLDYINFTNRVNNPFSFSNTRRSPQSLLELFDQRPKGKGKKIVMLSVAGYGKTWEMENLAAYYAKDTEAMFPVRNYLKDYEGQSIDALLELHNKDWKFISDESLLLIFDGLDEIQEDQYQSFINHINQFSEAKPQVNIIISTRYNFYDLTSLPLRGFDIYVLEGFTSTDISTYINKLIPNQKDLFQTKIKAAGISEYVNNPYYLSRLVRLFNNTESEFPANKTELFNHILFERLNKDKGKYRLSISREKLLVLAQKVAFCMTVFGKSVLSEDDMEQVLPDERERNFLKHFFLLNKNVSGTDTWSFEHKNLQEYLCASFLQNIPFISIIKLVTFPYDTEKLQLKFLNTFSFLFAITDTKSDFFTALFDWLTQYEPELLIRFERERIPIATRREIFKSIITYYKDRNLMLFASSKFTTVELANFVEIDEYIIVYLEELLAINPADWLASDCIDLLAECKKPYLFSAKLKQILYKELSNKNCSLRVIESCVNAFAALGFFAKADVARVISLTSNKNDFNVRKALLRYISKTEYLDCYCDFILDSIPVYEQGQRSVNEHMANENLKRLILKLSEAKSIRKILDYIGTHIDFLDIDHNEGLQLNEEEFGQFMEAVTLCHKQDNRILPLVYKIYRKIRELVVYNDWFEPFKKFFEHSCGNSIIFYKLHRYDKTGYSTMRFADKACCDFLVEEFRLKKITYERMAGYRNLMSHSQSELYQYFYEALKREFGKQFIFTVVYTDYQQLYQDYELKNQQMLLNRDLFFQEVDLIFEEVNKEKIIAKDLYDFRNNQVMKFNNSIALNTLRRSTRKTSTSKIQLIGHLRDETEWDSFKIREIVKLLGRKDLEINSELISFANSWCKDTAQTLDYENAVVQHSDGSVTFNRKVEFNNRLYLLLEVELPDELLLKKMLSDFRGGHQLNSSVSGMVIKKISDKTLLKKAVLRNLKKNLPYCILNSQFAICHQLGYTEALEDLYLAASKPDGFSEYEKIPLIEYYIDLGGSITDFKSLVTVPQVTEDSPGHLLNWHLISKLLPIDTDFTTSILLQVISNDEQPESHKIKACELLIKSKRIEGLDYWFSYTVKHRKLPFEHRQDVILQHCPDMNISETSKILIQAFEFTYVNGLHESLRFPNSMEQAIYEALNAIAIKNIDSLNIVNLGLDNLIQKHHKEEFARLISYYKELITHHFYQLQTIEHSLPEVLDLYNKITTE